MNDASHKLFWSIIAGMVTLHLISWVAYMEPGLRGPVLALVGILGVVVGFRRPAWLAYLSIGELVIGGQGFLLFSSASGFQITLRMALFVALCLVSLVQLFRQPIGLPSWWKPVTALLVWVIIMGLLGLMQGLGGIEIWRDMNGYFYLASLFGWWILLQTDPKWPERVLVILLAGVTLIGLKTWITQIIFTEQPNWITSWYRWIRNTGAGEITHIQGSLWRVFLQSQVYSLLGVFVTLGGFMTGRVPRWWIWPMIAGGLGVAISLSRSFWLGGGVAGLFLLWFTWRRFGWAGLRRWLIIIPLGAAVWLLMLWSIRWPYIFSDPGRGAPNPVIARLTAEGSSQAGDARREQIPPLLNEIQKQPVIGHGFGKTVTYYSPDPRIKGYRTTSAFELGYLDQLLDFGLIGLGLLAWCFWWPLKRLWNSPWSFLFLASTLALLVTHLTSPYLNHPLGLGWLGIITIFATKDHE